MHHKEMSVVHGEQKWKCGVGELKRNIRIDADTLNVQGQSMDAVYNGLLSKISGLSASTREEYKGNRLICVSRLNFCGSRLQSFKKDKG